MNIPDARLVHQTQGRMRLRIPSKRRDLDYFVDLYERTRQLPGINDVVINPTTASVLVHYDEDQHSDLSATLGEMELFSLTESAKQRPPVANESSTSDAPSHAAANDTRIVVFLIMLGVSIHQLRRGQVLAPALTILLYGLDLGAGLLKERQSTDVKKLTS